MLTRINKVKPSVMRKCPGFLRKGVVILVHDNTCPHAVQLTYETINKLAWETLPQPPYSADVAPSDFHLVGTLKEALHGTKFNNVEVKGNVLKWPRHQHKGFFGSGIEKLIQRWDKCIMLLGIIFKSKKLSY